jgi:hypothetical protein
VGSVDVVGYSVLMFDHVSLEIPSMVPRFSSELIRIFSGSREDIFPRNVSLAEKDDTLVVSVRSQVPREVRLSMLEVNLLRWFGPRVLVDGEWQPLWTWRDAVDSLALWLVAWWLCRAGCRRASSEPS